MSNLTEDANKLIAEAKEKGKCLDQAKNVERKLEDVKNAAGAGNTGVFIGGVAIVAGAILAFTPFSLFGVGLALGGATGVAAGLDAKGTALQKATTELKRAVEDLEACLRG